MALGRSVTDGFRKLVLEAHMVSGADVDVQSLAIRPILRPYAVFAVARIMGAGGEVYDLELLWQATPRIPENADQGPAVSIGAEPRVGGV